LAINLRKVSNMSMNDDIDSTKNYMMLKETEEEKKRKEQLYRQLGFQSQGPDSARAG
jgi:hypothetical protein